MWKKTNYNEYIITEWVVILGIRDEQKLETRKRIIDETTKLIQEKGFVKVSTKEISTVCELSQGTIFLHFGTKNELLQTILQSNLDYVRNDLTTMYSPDMSQELFIRDLVNLFVNHENMLSRIYKDYSYLPDDLKKEVDDFDTQIKTLFFDNLKQNWSTSVNIIETFILIDAFISQIKAYLLEKNPLSVNLVLKQRRGRIMKLYRILFGGES